MEAVHFGFQSKEEEVLSVTHEGLLFLENLL
jgi:hypothetical protein